MPKKKPSELGGEDPTPAGLQAQVGADSLSSSEKLRLIYQTGQELDPAAPLDSRAFHGQIEGSDEW